MAHDNKDLLICLCVADTIKDFAITMNTQTVEAEKLSYTENICYLIYQYVKNAVNKVDLKKLKENQNNIVFTDLEKIENFINNDSYISSTNTKNSVKNKKGLKEDIFSLNIVNKKEVLVNEEYLKKLFENNNYEIAINDSSIYTKSKISDDLKNIIKNLEKKNVSTIFNSMHNNNIQELKSKEQSEINYSLEKSNGELLLFDKIDIVNQDITFFYRNQSCKFSKVYRKSEDNKSYNLRRFALIINRIKNTLDKNINTANTVNTANIANTSNNNSSRVLRSFNINDNFNADGINTNNLAGILSNNTYKSISTLLRLKLNTNTTLPKLSPRVVNGLYINTNVNNNSNNNNNSNTNYISLEPLEYIFALFDIKRSMDLLQIKFALSSKNCYYISNDIISVAFSLVYKCPTIFHDYYYFGSTSYKDDYYIYEDLNSNSNQTNTKISGKASMKNSNKKYNSQSSIGGYSEKNYLNIYNTNNSNIYNTTTKTYKNLKDNSNLSNLKKLLNSKSSKNNIESPNKILNKKIKLSFIKKNFGDKIEFIEFIDKLSLITKSITYFDFFIYHFIFTINVPNF